jgi:hypothetical protein
VADAGTTGNSVDLVVVAALYHFAATVKAIGCHVVTKMGFPTGLVH